MSELTREQLEFIAKEYARLRNEARGVEKERDEYKDQLKDAASDEELAIDIGNGINVKVEHRERSKKDYSKLARWLVNNGFDDAIRLTIKKDELNELIKSGQVPKDIKEKLIDIKDTTKYKVVRVT